MVKKYNLYEINITLLKINGKYILFYNKSFYVCKGKTANQRKRFEDEKEEKYFGFLNRFDLFFEYYSKVFLEELFYLTNWELSS